MSIRYKKELIQLHEAIETSVKTLEYVINRSSVERSNRELAENHLKHINKLIEQAKTYVRNQEEHGKGSW